MATKLQQEIIARIRATRNKKRRVKWQLPTGVMAEEREYMRDIERYTNTLSKLTAKHLIKKLPEIERQRALEISVKDAFGDEIESSLATIRLELGREWTQKELVDIAKKRGISVSKVNQINQERNWKRVVGIDLVQAEPWLADYLGAYALNNAQLISSVGDRYLNEISNIVYQGFTSGTRWEDIAESIAERFGVAESRADLIARDQVNKLNGSITQVRQQALGVDRYTWRTMGDDRVRESHREKDGNIYSWDDPPSDTGHPSEEINCVLPDTIVSFSGKVSRAWKRFYTGKIMEITNEAGIVISVTPNHPILTGRGWIRAKEVQSSDRLVQCLNPEMLDLFDAKIKYAESTAQNCFNFLSVGNSSERIGGTDVQFHGDGRLNEEVEVVNVPRILPDAVDFSFCKKLMNLFLSNSNHLETPLFGLSHFSELVHRNSSPFYGSMGIFNLPDPFASSHLAPFQLLCFRLTSDMNVIFDKFFSNESSRGLENLRNFIFGMSAIIKRNNLRYFDVFSLRNSSAFYSHFGVTSVVVKNYDGYVYNFSTSNNTYNANSICVHNCRCYAEPVIDDLLE